MSSRFKRVVTNKWFLGTIVVVIVLTFVAGQELLYMTRQYMAGDTAWDPTPKQREGRVVFDPHFSMHPGHYTFTEKLNIATKVDVMKLVRMDPDKRKRGFAEFSTIRTQTPVGSPAPDFELETVDGALMRLSDKRGKYAVFMFVAMTCPPARTQVDLWQDLEGRYERDEVDIFFVYSRERHAGERGYRDFAPTNTTAERMAHARLMAEITDFPIAVDPADERTLQAYGMVPNAAFVVDPGGYIVFKSQWADVHKIRRVLDQLLRPEEMLQEVES